jgi:hypothetical protein
MSGGHEVLHTVKISRRDNLDRYYLLKLFGFGLFLHRIHHDEDPDTFHSHPWSGLSLIFGSYTEEILGRPKRRKRLFNLVRAKEFHRVELSGQVWTLFLHGRKNNRWQVKSRSGEILDTEPWSGIGGRTSYKPDLKAV